MHFTALRDGGRAGRGDEHGRHHAFDALRTGIPSVNYFALVLITFFSLFMYFFGRPLGLCVLFVESEASLFFFFAYEKKWSVFFCWAQKKNSETTIHL